ncbi:7-cyano-7-deazaguanine synthase QueC [Legionella impletisoli]|uniref:7-cyano-7-deazaguanine synthase n=1 Tax=Legionella impletisoli TaxID=343510 RepID=A0A917JTW9_9GAMM|nr:7-cyano-7-deazaguanine synthase QueC [Legionella impletisoli]GGI86890.1 7-cyano-7-deazaguanine synthase [Legionella impletisoli]
MKKAVILLSGGLDSATCLAIAKDSGFQCYALSFSYGQKHSPELEAARDIAATMGVNEHKMVHLDLGQFGGSALTDDAIAVPSFQETTSIPVTYVPARNTIFLSIALGYAEVLGAYDLFIGANAVDYSNYPDCRFEFIEAFQNLANIATKAGTEGQRFTIHAPLLTMTKSDIIKTGVKLGVDYGLTVSCYQLDSQKAACGVCDSCTFRARGFQEANVLDPTLYQ